MNSDEAGGGGTGGIDELRGGVVVVGASTLIWLRSRPGAKGGGAGGYTTPYKYYLIL